MPRTVWEPAEVVGRPRSGQLSSSRRPRHAISFGSLVTPDGEAATWRLCSEKRAPVGDVPADRS